VAAPPGLYAIRIKGRLGAALSAFPSMVSELKGQRDRAHRVARGSIRVVRRSGADGSARLELLELRRIRAKPISREPDDNRPPHVHDNRNSSDALAVEKPTDMSENPERSIAGEWTQFDTVSESTNPDRLAFRSPAQQRWTTPADPACSRRWLIFAVVGVPRVMVVLDTTRESRRMTACTSGLRATVSLPGPRARVRPG
jgi:hypothetical protein